MNTFLDDTATALVSVTFCIATVATFVVVFVGPL